MSLPFDDSIFNDNAVLQVIGVVWNTAKGDDMMQFL
jgi:hypothetical protein